MPNNYVLLERIELNASAASVTFANIPQTGYTDLKIVFSTRDNNAQAQNGLFVSINGSTANFTNKYLLGSGSAASSGSIARFLGYSSGAGATANTFSNGELYFPNYTSSDNKSFSSDNVQETNASTAYMVMSAHLWSQTAAITSISLIADSASFVQYSTFSLYGLAATGTTPAIAPKASGGNKIDYDGTYWIHTFNTNGTFTPQTGLTCDYLVVAGGAGWNSGDVGGGGGAGGLRSTVTATGGGGSLESALSLLTGTNYTVTIGAGGNNSNGSDSVFSTITSTGGGKPGAFQTAGSSGGSGGGAGTFATLSGGAGTANQGYAGGSSQSFAAGESVYQAGGGGGGANAVGSNATQATGGAGGAGVATSITGSSVTYAGGGGGWGGATGGAAGSGGGGAGYGGTGIVAGGNGTANTGGGAGGGRASSTGGSGIVIIRYLA